MRHECAVDFSRQLSSHRRRSEIRFSGFVESQMRKLFCGILKLSFFGNCHENTRKYSRACGTLAKTAKGVLSQ